ncbi:MAG: hypothetical protein H6Q82_546, partial [Deltaproteobacteria bacterium]|nr:hypothetical protein [Deltaproteobacteria bacterium]
MRIKVTETSFPNRLEKPGDRLR